MEKKKQSTRKQTSNKKNIAKKVEVVKDEPVVTEVKEVKQVTKESKTKSHDHSLFKALAILILIAVVLTWIIPSGYFNGADYIESDIVRLGINEVFISFFYGANYYLIQIAFVLMVGAFYGIVSHLPSYKALIEKLTNFWRGKEKAFVLVHTLIIALYVSMATQSFPILLFVPMIISVANKLGFSKFNSLMITFGAMIAGMVGGTFSTYGTDYIVQYMDTSYMSGIAYRFGILAITYILVNVLIFSTMNKKKDAVIEDDIFAAEAQSSGKAWKAVLLFGIIFIIMILGFIPWSEVFEIEVFDDFRKWLTTDVTIHIGDTDHPIFKYILGNIVAFGSWDIYTMGYVTLVILLIVKFTARLKLNDCIEYMYEGAKKMFKPALYIMFAYAMFVVSYTSGFTTYIIDWLSSIGKTVTDATTTYVFNPFTNALANGISQILHVDFGYTGFVAAPMYVARFPEYATTIMAIMIAMNGFVSFFAPTSVVLLVGLSMYNVSYKEWLKYIWKFVLILLFVLLALFALMTFI